MKRGEAEPAMSIPKRSSGTPLSRQSLLGHSYVTHAYSSSRPGPRRMRGIRPFDRVSLHASAHDSRCLDHVHEGRRHFAPGPRLEPAVGVHPELIRRDQGQFAETPGLPPPPSNALPRYLLLDPRSIRRCGARETRCDVKDKFGAVPCYRVKTLGVLATGGGVMHP